MNMNPQWYGWGACLGGGRSQPIDDLGSVQKSVSGEFCPAHPWSPGRKGWAGQN
ncbi:MAG: hypothetical protein GX587_16290 [Bacteroidales bacterium]|nr:hypothetical protein [Bacteroidales bacterium]